MKLKFSLLDMLLITATVPLVILAGQICAILEVLHFRSTAQAMAESRQQFREQAFLKRTELCNEIFAHDEYPAIFLWLKGEDCEQGETAMKEFFGKHLTAITWIVWALVATTLVAFSASLRSERRNYREQIAADEQAIRELSAAIARDKRSVAGVAHLQKKYHDNDLVLHSLMKQSASLAEFPIRSGPRIAWCELPTSNEFTRRFALYLPPGQHLLGYAVLDNFRQITPQVEEAAACANAVAYSMGSSGGVFEVIVRGTSPHVAFASAKELLCERPVNGLEGPWRLQVQLPESTFAFPSEWRPKTRVPFREGELAPHPITELAIVKTSQVGTLTTRLLFLWIESSTAPCVTTLTAARSYETLTGVEHSTRYDPTILNAPAREREFERLLEPNNHSGRMYFRKEIFAPPRFAPRGVRDL